MEELVFDPKSNLRVGLCEITKLQKEDPSIILQDLNQDQVVFIPIHSHNSFHSILSNSPPTESESKKDEFSTLSSLISSSTSDQIE